MLRSVIAVGVGVGLNTSMSCTPARNSAAENAPDSVTGTVSVTGTSFEQRLVLRTGDSAVRLSVAAPDSAALTRLSGVEVMVTGRRDGNLLEVERFVAVRVAGAQVVDGVLRNDGGRLSLETHQGTVQLGNPPDALRGMIGARVWVGGPLDRGPNVYGVITPAR